MWVVPLAHPTINKFRLIAGMTRETAEEEAAGQMVLWNIEARESLAAGVGQGAG
jgi:hypothetical protein